MAISTPIPRTSMLIPPHSPFRCIFLSPPLTNSPPLPSPSLPIFPISCPCHLLLTSSPLTSSSSPLTSFSYPPPLPPTSVMSSVCLQTFPQSSHMVLFSTLTWSSSTSSSEFLYVCQYMYVIAGFYHFHSIHHMC